MTQKQMRNNRYIILLFAMTIIPFLIAGYLAENRGWMNNTTNMGELIIPPVTTERNELTGYDDFSRNNIDELVKHWVLIHIIPGAECSKVCLEALHKTKQLRLMMNKDLARIRRVAIILKPVDQDIADRWWKEDARLLRVIPKPSMVEKIKKITRNNNLDGLLLIMDPLGNIMMQYRSGFDPYDVKKDLTRLLKVSQIG